MMMVLAGSRTDLKGGEGTASDAAHQKRGPAFEIAALDQIPAL
jgi:hypothetical protein